MANRRDLKNIPLYFAALLLGGLIFSPAAQALTVSGTISDVNGAVVPYVKVCVMDYNPGWFDTERDCVETDAAGAYSSSKVEVDDDVYLLVYYETPIDPAPASFAPGHKLKLVNNNSSTVISFSTANHAGGYLPDLKTNAVMNIPAAAGQPALGNEVRVLQAVHDEMNFIRAQGVSNFKVDYDIWGSINTSDADEWPNATSNDKTLHMGINRVNNAEWYAMYHELGHIIQYQSYSPPRHPRGRVGGTHMRASHSDTGFAMTEGWAEAIGDLVADANGHPHNATSPDAWRGREAVGTPSVTLGTPSGSDNSGEVVEGAICEMIKQSNFRFMMESLVASNPETYKELAAGFLARSGEGPEFIKLVRVQREWGVVYSRAKFTGFEEGEPFKSGGKDPGNAVKIDNIMFLRGLIHPKYDQNTQAELNLVGSTIGIHEIRMGYREASNGLDENLFGSDGTFNSWTQVFPYGNKIEFKTAELPSDRDLDLILEVKDVHNSWDDFNPSFSHDPIPPGGKDYSSDERWLKHLGTWYNQDDFADNDDEGKVIVDNNDPVVNQNKIKPAGETKQGWITSGSGVYIRIKPSASKA